MILIFIIFTFSFWSSHLFVFIPSSIGVISAEFTGEWLQWMGSFIGGTIGGIFAFIGIKITLENQRKDIEFENKRKALPLIDIYTGDYDYKNKYVQFDFWPTEKLVQGKRKDIQDTARVTLNLENVGLREMYDLYIGDIESDKFNCHNDYYFITPIIYHQKSIALNLSFFENVSFVNLDKKVLDNLYISPITFKCYFRDCYDNWYHQHFSLSLMHRLNSKVSPDQRSLDISIERYEILSRPIEISQEKLPWELGNPVSTT